MFRIRALSLPAAILALAASCAGSPTTSPPSSPPPSSPTTPTPTSPPVDSDVTAVQLGVAIDARASDGAPRLVRAVIPRVAKAGMTPDQAARDHLAALAPLWLSHQRPAALTTHSVQQLRNGASIVRLQQHIDNIPIHQGELRVMVHPDGSLVAVSGTVLPNAGRAAFQSTASAALDRALDALYGQGRARPAITEAAAQDGYSQLTVAAAPSFRVQTARARRELFPDGGQQIPMWSVELFADKPGAATVAHRFLIADGDGRTLRDVDLTANDAFVYRALAETTGTRIPLDGPLESFAPHPTGFPDGSLPGFGPYPLVVQEAFNGPHDPWLGVMATTTSGNNVEAFADINPPDGFSEGDVRPDVRGGRTLNHIYDFAAEPLSSIEQSKAAAVNVFYVTNWLHDWYYDSGFTEATGNAQVDNFGRGGIGGDPLVAHAQDEANDGARDNANMQTPEDGLSPAMNMFLWSGATTSSLSTPTAAPTTAIVFNAPRNFDVTGSVVQIDSACLPVTENVTGKIALIEFDFGCISDTAVDNVKAAGAIGAIFTFIFPGFPAFELSESVTAAFPALVISFDDGAALAAQLPATVTLHQSTSTEHDGDFDNSVIAHEWGHYLHHRLASCEATQQCAAMSEGWGDFNSLLLMLRETDDRDGTFAEGIYDTSTGGLVQFGEADPGYFGIRRFPYSTDRTKNALSFRHISDDEALPDGPNNPFAALNANSEIHNAGEVWAETLWEVYNVLIDQHGFTESHRRMSDYVVAGLLLTPPEATYTEARDALLAAAGALDSDDMLLMAAAFAGRGAGTCAVSPPQTSFNFIGVVESGTVAAKLATGTATLTDDTASCDHDGYLDPGETGTLRLTIANNGVVAAEQVVAKVTTTTAGVTLGAPVMVGTLAARSQIDIAIPVKGALGAPTNASLDLAIEVDGDAGCNTSALTLAMHERMGVDELAASATTDSFETRSLAWTRTGALADQFWGRIAGVGANHVLFGADAPFPTDTQVVSPVLQVSPTQPLVVTVHHAFDLEEAGDAGPFFDGGVIEISSDAGATWRDVTEVGADPMYPVIISPDDPTHPLQGRPGFGGRSPGFPALQPLTLNFGTQFAGQAIQLRFRLASDFCCNATGWTLDDISVTGTVNAPFPSLVAEPTRCTAPSAAAVEDRGVIAVRQGPHTSLAGFPVTAAP
jgi:hypothetical protein